ncbi:DUF4012 domain-containing protein [Streptomyces himalayensis]|uniref:DUF4012 domain-containing protein n=1 Tax=Streptomyces himalayensis subsp. himalayensis TaxID=2756131 RepID=A0A7W0DHJ2_9ACTN|nr:DUF4012 domain-containing protein [Streptomyces himalayensis]MBA2945211.1 DUF4012 domain-containing protein [Streptomyces himalayensis subsp. himalayensis]
MPRSYVRPGPVQDARDLRLGGLRRPARTLLLVATGLLLAGAAWIVVTGLLARSELLAAQQDLDKLRQSFGTASAASSTAAAATRQSGLDAAMRSAAEHAARAHRLTTGPAWYPGAHLPFIGEPVRTVRGAAYAADRLTGEVLPPLVRAVPEITVDARKGGVPQILAALQGQAPAIARAAHVAAEVRSEVRELPSSTWLRAADRAHTQLSRQLDRLSTAAADASVAARALPPMLGAQGTRRYLLVFQNTAEARGTGGLPGAFAVLSADNGRLRFERFGNDTELGHTSADVNLGAEYAALYGRHAPTRVWVNSNVSPHFPHAARIWTAAWRKHSGQRVDGVIALDPSTLSLLLRATGPARLPDGTALTADNAVDLTMRASYATHEDVLARKAFFIDAARAAAARLMDAADDPRLIPAMVRAVHEAQQEGRLKLWSARQSEQRLLESRLFGGALPDTPGPFAGLIVNNAAGTKLDYYLDRRLTWTPGRCTPNDRSVTATVTLVNRAPASGLPTYVTQRLDKRPYRTRPGDNRLLVSYYASVGASLTRTTLDGRPVMLHSSVERGHPVYTFDLELPAQSSRTLVLHLREPLSDRAPVLQRQPLVIPLQATVTPGRSCQA